eukprot:scaffold1188_cov33-Tisochrysis_lutea.AAC.2
MPGGIYDGRQFSEIRLFSPLVVGAIKRCGDSKLEGQCPCSPSSERCRYVSKRSVAAAWAVNLGNHEERWASCKSTPLGAE